MRAKIREVGTFQFIFNTQGAEKFLGQVFHSFRVVQIRCKCIDGYLHHIC